MQINKVAVIGAGTMGAGIAGQVANAGVDVYLLDLPSDEETSVNALAEKGLQRLKNPQQPGLVSDDVSTRIHVGNIRDDFHELQSCDWIAEAVVERLDIKKALYQRINDICSETTIITSNTSTIPIRLLVEEMPESFKRRFAITHFFNPVRFMQLLELVCGEFTDEDVIRQLADFCDRKLGKGVVHCADTPGFLGNRVGVYAIQCALHGAFKLGLQPLQADALFGRPMGIPKTGVFGLYDLIGIDLMSDVVESLVNILPAEDAFHEQAIAIDLMTDMIAKGQCGNKTGQGFYRLDTASGQRYVMDLKDGTYQIAEKLDIPLAKQAEVNGLHTLLADPGLYGQYTWHVLSRTLSYAASLIPEVGDDPTAIDDAMKLGYNWIKGPFEMLDDIGIDYFVERLLQDNMLVPEYLRQALGSTFYQVSSQQIQARQFNNDWQNLKRPQGVVRFSELRKILNPVQTNEKASWYIIDDVALVEFHSKANALDAESMAILADALVQVPLQGLRALVVHNDAQHFSCGVNLRSVRDFYQRNDLDGLDLFLKNFQQIVYDMSRAAFPVVVAPSGLSIGGGFEVLLHAKQVICHANSVMGLVESRVGLVPAGGGCKETLYRWLEKLGSNDVTQAAWKSFKNLGYGITASSPLIAEKQAMLRVNDRYEINRGRLFSAAMAAVDEPSSQHPFDRPDLAMPGEPLLNEMLDWLNAAADKGNITAHDKVVGTEIAKIVSGGEIPEGSLWSEQDLYAAERRAFLSLVETDATRARIESMLEKGKPVRN